MRKHTPYTINDRVGGENESQEERRNSFFNGPGAGSDSSEEEMGDRDNPDS